MNTYKILNKTLGAVALSILFSTNAIAQKQAAKDMKVLNKEIKKKGNKVNVYMDLNLDDVKLASNKGLIFTPILYKGEDTLKLPAVEVMGNKRYIYYQRTKKTATQNPLIVAKRENKEPQTLRYAYSTPYQDWMKNSNFAISNDACGCNQKPLAENLLTNHGEALVTPQQLYQAYQQPKAEAVKIRQENGSARLNFRINKWDIVKDLGNNTNELATIKQTLDLVKNDPDVTITSITLHGYASPSGSNNIRNAQLFPQLNEVVERISQALKQSIDMQQNEATNIEMAEDELHRAEYENGKLHIANSVLDNCLSTLKHETMYYPSRIRQLIDSTPEDVTSLQELVDYYKAIYTMLSAQAMEQVEGTVKCDADLLAYLRKLITGGVKNFTYQEATSSSTYVTCQYILHDIPFDATRHPHLFTPLTSDMKYLVARQIVREIGEATNLRGCGILAKPSSDGKLMIEIVLPEKIIKTKT